MYCSSCGSAVPTNLTYCNKCGARLGSSKTENLMRPSELPPESLVWAICGIFIMGTGVMIGLLAVLKEVVGFNLGLIAAVMLLGFGLIVAIESVLVYLLLSGRKAARRTEESYEVKEAKPLELNEPQRGMLQEPPASVTEHTTRTFEPIYTERR
jgi:hypothetical protein